MPGALPDERHDARTLGAARHRPDPARVDFRGVTGSRFRDGLLVLWDTIYDNLAVARQMGLVPPHGSRGDRLFTPSAAPAGARQTPTREKADTTDAGGAR